MSKASEKTLHALHNAVAEMLTTEIQRYTDGEYDEIEVDEQGVEIARKRKPVPASLIQSTIKYLKDNGVDRPEDEEPDPSDLLNDQLPSFQDEY